MNNNNQKYRGVFLSVFPDWKSEFDESFTFDSIEEWDSLTHMDLVTKLEDEFQVFLDTNDILHFGSYENGKKILERYGVNFE